ncbi:EF-hand domain-containing protein [Sphingomonas sanguinis]|uniref:EF-hand domain-containing protein n=1 Tax=Sphingomonas sanguinis TaxID=33051 RepID=A0A7Y7URR4_9SPHN|nr:EF-hand domain-containing protein [Sphingomonas sanguinis]MBZ6381838.1 EF-hand domain-containing protein [Sphingomonas sanguinis]NNG49328.1 EF-hand domain-containing protein [Sphingomonas sanguinis]NNG54064.1 EF-hand domain-containing protein [Sphingomonas sanguinis]NVP31138.1 EF-hand domain-containing protein [Sphingomonas sanguinis]
MTRFLLAGLIAATLTVPALAQQDTRASAAAKFSREFKARDTNHDGVLTKAEVKAAIMKMGNGKKQIDAVHAQRLTDLWFDKADANKDGKVTEAEAQALLSRTFDEYEAAKAAQTKAAGPVAGPKGR